jgi:hypothetical protein
MEEKGEGRASSELDLFKTMLPESEIGYTYDWIRNKNNFARRQTYE